MKRILTGLLLTASVLATANAQFSAGNLAVLRVGDGTQTLANTGNSVFIDQFTTSGGMPSYTVAIPSSGASALVVSGSSSAEGALARSADGNYLTFGGYNLIAGPPYASSLANSASSAVARGVGRVDAAGNYVLGPTTGTMFGGTSSGLRGVVTDGANNYWGVGAASAASTRGTYYFGTASTAATVQSGNSPRVAAIFGGNLYASISSTTAGLSGINVFSGLPTASQTASQLIFTGDGSSPYDFALNPSMTLAYVADDRTATGGGIQRWDWSGSTWTLSYTLSTGASSGGRGLAVDFGGVNPVIYATTSETSTTAQNRLIAIVDTGASSAFSLLTTAPANENFRGLDWTPGEVTVVPEPTWIALFGLGLLAFWDRRRRAR